MIRATRAAGTCRTPTSTVFAPEDRAAGWERTLGLERARAAVLVAEQAGAVTRFASLGPAQDPEGTGELYAINVDPDAWGTGAGWVADGTERTAEVLGVTVPEVRYRRRSTSEEISSATPVGTE